MGFIPYEKSKTMIEAPKVFRALGEHFGRSPITMRRVVEELGIGRPVGFTLKRGVAVRLYPQGTIERLIKFFMAEPPKGSGRPKGAKNRTRRIA